MKRGLNIVLTGLVLLAIFYMLRRMGKFQSRNLREAASVLGEEIKTYAGDVQHK